MSTVATAVSYWSGERVQSLIAGKGMGIALNTTLLIASVTMLAAGKNLGFAHTYIDPDSKLPFAGLSQIAFLVSFFTLNFGLVNFTLARPGLYDSRH